MTEIDRERLAAFVDGELSPEEAAAVVMHLADHPEDQAYVDGLLALNETLGQAYGDPMTEPTPQRIVEVLADAPAAAQEAEGAVVTPFRPRGRRRYVAWGGAGALAAGIAAFALFTGAPPGENPYLASEELAARSPAAAALNELSAGETRIIGDDVEIVVISSFRIEGRGVCREYEIVHQDGALHDHGLACPSEGEGWRVAAQATTALETPDEGFTPASGLTGDRVSDFLDDAGAGLALSADEEDAARAAGWR